jgi:microsomal dipeptidase-like Zn-dependent dipeptidase
MWDTPLLHDPDRDNFLVEVMDVLPDVWGGNTLGVGWDVDSGEIVEWFGSESVMEKLLAKLREHGDEPVYVEVNIMQERARYAPNTKEQV